MKPPNRDVSEAFFMPFRRILHEYSQMYAEFRAASFKGFEEGSYSLLILLISAVFSYYLRSPLY